jgi:hypothetical protein
MTGMTGFSGPIYGPSGFGIYFHTETADLSYVPTSFTSNMLTISGGNAITNGTYVGSGSSYQSASSNFYNAFTVLGGYNSGLQWKSFYGAINDYTSIASSTTANSFQTQSRYSSGANSSSSISSNVLVADINYYNNIAATGNRFGFSNTNGNGDNGYFISLVITGYFKPNQTGTWNFQFGSSNNNANDDFSIFWINDGANVNGTTTHWPPSDTNYNIFNYNNSNWIYTTTLTADVYYPIQITWSQAAGGSTLGFAYKGPGMGSYVYNGSGYFFYGSNGAWNSGVVSSAFATNGNTLTYTQNPYNGSGVYVGGGNSVLWQTVVNEVGTICGEYIQIQFPQPMNVIGYSLKFS